MVAAKVRPLDLETVLAEFGGAWASGDPAAVADFLYPTLRAQREAWLGRSRASSCRRRRSIPRSRASCRPWRRSDARAIAELFPAGYEDRMREHLERTAERRGWSGFPKILATERTEGENGERVVTLTTARDRVIAKWVLRGVAGGG